MSINTRLARLEAKKHSGIGEVIVVHAASHCSTEEIEAFLVGQGIKRTARDPFIIITSPLMDSRREPIVIASREPVHISHDDIILSGALD